VESDFHIAFGPYDAASSAFHKERVRLHDQRIAAGLFESMTEAPRDMPDDGIIRVISSVHHSQSKTTIFRLVKIHPGEDSALDAAGARRRAARNAMAGFFNDMVRRFL
jgi:hypothetical protein